MPLPILHNLPLKRKLQAIIMLTVSTALVLACSALAAYEYAGLRGSMQRHLQVLAQMIGSNSSAALLFNDQKSALELLQGMQAQPHIVAVCIYSMDGSPFATYVRPDAARTFSPPTPAADRSAFERGRLILFHTVTLDQRAIGTVYLESDTREMYMRLAQSIGINYRYSDDLGMHSVLASRALATSGFRTRAAARSHRQCRCTSEELFPPRGSSEQQR